MAYTLLELDRDTEAMTAPIALGFEVSEDADAGDENLFRARYERHRAAWVDEVRQATENEIRAMGTVAPEDAQTLIAEARANAAVLLRAGLTGFFLAPDAPPRFDEAAAKRYFAVVFRRRLTDARKEFPAPLLKAVSDERYLALGVISPRLKARIRQYRIECKERSEREGAAYRADYERLVAAHPKFRDFDFRDRTIVSFRRKGTDMVMKLETYNKLTFKNAAFLRRDGALGGWEWRSWAAHILDSGFEVEILARNDEDARLVVLRCDDVEIAHAPEGTPGYVLPGHEDWFAGSKDAADPAYTLADYDRDVQATRLSFGLVAAESAAEFDEVLFRLAYEQLLNNELTRERNNMEEHNRKLAEGTLNPWVLDAVGTAPRVFDPAKVRRKFAERIRARLRKNPGEYPPAIYTAVADPRMFALRIVSPRVLKMIKAYVAQCEKRHRQDREARNARYRRLISEHPRLRAFSYHDETIVSFRRAGKDMVMKLDTPVRLTFKNATILRRDGPLRGNYWCYEEVRPLTRGYEVEIFTWGRINRLVILRCDDIEIENLPYGTPGYALPERG